MAIQTVGVGSGLTRSGAYLSASLTGLWTFQNWIQIPSLPTGTDRYCVWHWGDGAHVNPYIGLYIGSTGAYTECFDGVLTTRSSVASQQALLAAVWFYFSLQHNGTTLAFYFNSRQQFNLIKNLALVTFVQTAEKFAIQAWTVNPSTDTPLNNTGSLNDVSGNGRNWTQVGALSTPTVGPLSFPASGIFSDDFNQVAPSQPFIPLWTDTPIVAGTAPNIGCGGSRAFGCNGRGQIWKGFDTHYQSGTSRWQMWTYWPSASGSPQQIWTSQSYPNGNDLATPFGFQAVLYFIGGGVLRLRLITGPGAGDTTNYDSASGAIALDGSLSAIQVTWTVSSVAQSVTVYVNNVVVISVVDAIVSGQNASYRSWNQVSMVVYNTAGLRTVVDNFQTEATVNPISWGPCSSFRVVDCVVVPTVNTRLTQLPIEAAYGYPLIQPVQSESASGWNTPQSTPSRRGR